MIRDDPRTSRASTTSARRRRCAILRSGWATKSSIIEDLPGNPLPRSYRIKLDDPDNVDLVKSSLQPAGANGKPQADQPRDRGDQGPRGRHEQDPLGDQHDQDPARFARRPAGARIRAAGRQHDPAVGLRPPARGRGDAAGRRDQLVHPLAVRDRGPDRRLPRRPGRGRAAVAGQGDRRRPVVGPLRADRRAARRSSSRCWSSLLLAAATAVSALGSGLTLRRFLRV